MHSKTESVSKNRNLAKLFTLTYGHFNEHKNYHKLPVTEVKSIVLKLEKKLAIFLLDLIKRIDCSKYLSWEHMNDDENFAITLQHAIVTECYDFIKFMKQNKFLVTNKYLSHCLKQLRRHIILPRKSTLTLSELCRDIDKGNLDSMEELAKRYKEWDLLILNFLMTRVKYLRIYDGIVILEYLHHIFAYLHTNAKKYQFYMSVLQILILLQVAHMNSIVQNYVERHFDDNPLEYLYDEECFTRFMKDTSYGENTNNEHGQPQLRILLIFILLNSRKVLSKIVMYEMIEADDIITELYITYLSNGSFDTNAISYILLHLKFMLENPHVTIYRLNYLPLMIALIKTVSLLRRYASFSKRIVSNQLKSIDAILSYMRKFIRLKTSVLSVVPKYNFQIEPLEIPKLQPMTNTLSIIQEYETNRI